MLEGEPREWIIEVGYCIDGRSGPLVNKPVRETPTRVLAELKGRIEAELHERGRLDMLMREREQTVAAVNRMAPPAP